MKRLTVRTLSFCAPLLFAAYAPLFAADELPKADTILDKYVEVTGGKAAYDKLHNEITTGTMEMSAMGIKGTITTYRAEPNKSYTEIDITGVGKVQEGYDGTVAWAMSAMQGPHIKQGDEKAQSAHNAYFHGTEDWKSQYKQVETAGTDTVDGKTCYKVVLTPNQGPPMTQFYDKDSGLLQKMTLIAKSAMGDIEAETTIGDYRKEGDVLVPHKITQSAAGQNIVITIDSVKYNTEIPKDKFALPAEIQALLKK
jgi:hypothetical protein